MKMEKITCPYLLKGFNNRMEYLENLADEYGVVLHYVVSLAQMLGPEEDFDGLVTYVDDISFHPDFQV